jgi:hypothetical protein
MRKDIKSDNILVKLPTSNASQIDKFLEENPAEVCGEPIEIKGDHPVVLAWSQPLPNFGLDESLENITVCLIDYSEGDPYDMLYI